MKRTTEILANFKVIKGKYSLSDRVGGGSFGDVFIGTDLKTGAKVCLKLSEKIGCSEIRKEVSVHLSDLTKGS